MLDVCFPEPDDALTERYSAELKAQLAQGDEHLAVALAHYAVFPDPFIHQHIVRQIPPRPRHYDDAATAVAEHIAACGEPVLRIAFALADITLKRIVPAWPNDPDHIAAIARTAVKEMQS